MTLQVIRGNVESEENKPVAEDVGVENTEVQPAFVCIFDRGFMANIFCCAALSLIFTLVVLATSGAARGGNFLCGFLHPAPARVSGFQLSAKESNI
jgi:hypothetical protein